MLIFFGCHNFGIIFARLLDLGTLETGNSARSVQGWQPAKSGELQELWAAGYKTGRILRFFR